MKRLLILLILFNCYGVYSQIKVSYGPELGINMSGIPNVKEHTADAVYVSETRDLPVISPIVGFFGEIRFGKHFLLNADLCYKKVGNTYYKLTYTEYLPDITYEIYIEQKFNVSSIPIVIGYNFLIGKSQFQIKTGYVFNYFFNGNRIINEKYSDSYSSIGTHSQLDPFDPEYFYIPASHWNNQWKLSIGMNIKEKWNLNIFSNLGYDLNYVAHNPFGGDSYMGTSLDNFDLGLIVKYNIAKIKKG